MASEPIPCVFRDCPVPLGSQTKVAGLDQAYASHQGQSSLAGANINHSIAIRSRGG